MELFATYIQNALGYLYFDYILGTVLIIYLIVKFILPNNIKASVLALFSFGISIACAFGIYFIGDYNPVKLILSLLVINAFYELLIKKILKLFGVEYKENDPTLLKAKKDEA